MKTKILKTNKDSLKPTHKAEHEPYEYRKYEVTPRSDFNQCYIAIYEIPPLKSNYPYHYHTQNTEAFYIISGEGQVETPDGVMNIARGDIIVCPPHEESAHRITNTSTTEMLTYIDFDTTNSPDIIHYPHSGKIGIIEHNKSNSFYEKGSQVSYYEGE